MVSLKEGIVEQEVKNKIKTMKINFFIIVILNVIHKVADNRQFLFQSYYQILEPLYT